MKARVCLLTKCASLSWLQARIDSDQKVLHRRMVDQRTSTFADVLELGNQYKVHSRSILLRAAMMKSGLVVRSSKERGPGMDEAVFAGMG